MSDYDLSLTGAQIDAALTKVHNADTSPVNGSANMITSNGVHDAVNDIQFANLNSNLVSTDLNSGNNNTTIPTTQAVSNLVTSGARLPERYVFQWTSTSGISTGFGHYSSIVPTVKQGSTSVGFSTTTPTVYNANQADSVMNVPTDDYLVNIEWDAPNQLYRDGWFIAFNGSTDKNTSNSDTRWLEDPGYGAFSVTAISTPNSFVKNISSIVFVFYRYDANPGNPDLKITLTQAKSVINL